MSSRWGEDRPWFEVDLPEEQWPFPKGTEVVCRWPYCSGKHYGVIHKCALHDYRRGDRFILISIDLHGGGRWGLHPENVWLPTPLELLAQVLTRAEQAE